MEQRIARLEKEMVVLRREMDELKHQQSQEKTTIQNMNKSITVQSALPTLKTKPTPPTPPIPTPKTNVQQGRSIEEQIMWALPKVFMVILVLGVLWG